MVVVAVLVVVVVVIAVVVVVFLYASIYSQHRGISGLLQELLSKTAENFQASEARRQEAEARLQGLWATCAEKQSQCLMSVCFLFRPELSGKYDGCDLISRDLH